MITLNLLPEEFRAGRRPLTKFAMPDIPVRKTLRLGLPVVLGAQLLFLVWVLAQVPVLSRMGRELDTLKAAHGDTLKQKSETKVLEAKLKNLDRLTTRKFYWTNILNEISNAVPDGVWLRALSPGTDKDPSLKLDGSVIAPGQETACIGHFIQTLKAGAVIGKLFEQIDLLNVSEKRIKDLEVYEFSLALVWKKDIAHD